jgi:hypothetical protein
MEQALIFQLISAYDATPALPTNLNNFTFIDQRRDCPLPAGERIQTFSRCVVRFHVMLYEFGPPPFQPFAHFLRIRTSGRPEEFKFSHGR